MTRVYALCQELDLAIPTGDRETIDPILHEIENALEPVFKAIKRLPRKGSGVKPSPLDSASLENALVELDKLLQKHSLSARKVFNSLKGALQNDENQPTLELIDGSLSRFNFNEARDHLQALARKLDIDLN